MFKEFSKEMVDLVLVSHQLYSMLKGKCSCYKKYNYAKQHVHVNVFCSVPDLLLFSQQLDFMSLGIMSLKIQCSGWSCTAVCKSVSGLELYVASAVCPVNYYSDIL